MRILSSLNCHSVAWSGKGISINIYRNASVETLWVLSDSLHEMSVYTVAQPATYLCCFINAVYI